VNRNKVTLSWVRYTLSSETTKKLRRESMYLWWKKKNRKTGITVIHAAIQAKSKGIKTASLCFEPWVWRWVNLSCPHVLWQCWSTSLFSTVQLVSDEVKNISSAVL
jgi:hypothetical protein